jgi:hypothetical protein
MCVALQFVKCVGVCTNVCFFTICEVCRSLYKCVLLYNM